MGRRKITRKSPEERKAQIAKLLARKPSKTTELAKAMKMHTSSVSTFLNEMIDEGTVVYAGEGGRGDPYVFSLANGSQSKTAKPKSTAIVKRAAEIVETLRVSSAELPKDEAMLGEVALAVRRYEKRGQVTFKKGSHVMEMLTQALDTSITNEA